MLKIIQKWNLRKSVVINSNTFIKYVVHNESNSNSQSQSCDDLQLHQCYDCFTKVWNVMATACFVLEFLKEQFRISFGSRKTAVFLIVVTIVVYKLF